MRRRHTRRGGIAVAVGSLLAVFALPAGQAAAAPEPLTDPAGVAALAAGLGEDRTAGVHSEDGRPVLAVTDQATAETVRDAGGTAEIVAHSNPNVIAYGTVQYRDGSESQITNSRPAVDGEKVKRVGTMSQDLDGMVLEPSVTVNYTDGSTYYNMIKTSLCNISGDSGGGMFTGTSALGITSGGNYIDQPCGDTDGQSDRVSYYQPVYTAIIPYGLKVY
jgi:hypothetical protein